MVTTERAKHFYSPQDVPVTLYSDTDEWEVSAGPLLFLLQDRTVFLAACGPGCWSTGPGLKSVVRAIWVEAMRKTSV